MNKKLIIKLTVLLLSLNVFFIISTFAQTQKMTTVVVRDADGTPVSGATVTIGESFSPVTTNERGEFIFQCLARIPVFIEAEGFESQLVIITPTMESPTITMVKALYEMADKDEVNMPFGTFKQRLIPGAVKALDVKKIQMYDYQRSYSGILRGRIPGIFGSTNFRQFGSPLLVIDGIPSSEMEFNIEQIEQITVIKDLASAMLYGVQAENGIILMKTRRGKPLKRTLNFTAERGINIPISYPKYLNAADYMELYNEALANDGLDPRYTIDQITNTRNGSDPIRYPDEDYYNSTYLRDFSTYNNIVGQASGGNDIAQYYVNVGWMRDNSILKLGEGGNEKNDRFNVRGNVNYKLTDFLNIIFDGAAIFNNNYAPRYTSASNNFWALSTTFRPNNTPVLIPASLMKDQDMLKASKLVDDKYLLGGTSEYQTNIYGELTRNGPRILNDKLINLKIGLELDLGSIVQGLSASGNLSFDVYNILQLDINNSYAVYRPNYAADTVRNFTKYKNDQKVQEQTLSSVTFYRRNSVYGTLDYHRIFKDKHNVTINGLAYRDEYITEAVIQPTKHLHFGIRANYTYDNKYIAELTGVYTGSVKLYWSTPWAFTPGIGLGWILSEENFLKDNSLINYLKLRTNFAVINTDEALTSYRLGQNLFTSSGTFYFNEGNNYNFGRVLSLGNPSIGFEKKMNYNLGFESMLLDYKLGFEASYFYYKNYDMLARRQNYHPIYLLTPPYENYGSNQTQGIELGLNTRQKIGDLEMTFGTNFAYAIPKILVIDEVEYEVAYRQRVGTATDAILSYVALGLFKDQAEIDAAPVQTFGTVKPGDIRYKDLNNDNIIDENDQHVIGNSSARIQYGFNLHLKYKSFELFTLGTGQYGQKRYYNNSYYWIYADRKYSEVVWDRWTPATAETATYPRLTTLSNPNNFRNSTFWLYDNNWFTLHTAQLTYNIPKIRGVDDARVFLRGSNLFTISKIKNKTQLNIGSSPQVRVVSLGLNLSL